MKSRKMRFLREEHRLKVSESGALRKLFGPKRDEMGGVGENCIMRALLPVLFSKYN
jgi:hypothetical protein